MFGTGRSSNRLAAVAAGCGIALGGARESEAQRVPQPGEGVQPLLPAAEVRFGVEGALAERRVKREIIAAPLPVWHKDIWSSLRQNGPGEFLALSLQQNDLLLSLDSVCVASQKEGPPTRGPAWSFSLTLLEQLSLLTERAPLVVDSPRFDALPVEGGDDATQRKGFRADGMAEVCRHLEYLAFDLNKLGTESPAALHMVGEALIEIWRDEASRTRQVSLNLLTELTRVLDLYRSEYRYRALFENKESCREYLALVTQLSRDGVPYASVFGHKMIDLSRYCAECVAVPGVGEDGLEQRQSFSGLLNQLLATSESTPSQKYAKVPLVSALDPLLPEAIANLLLVSEPVTREQLADVAPRLRRYIHRIGGGRSSLAFQQLADAGVFPTESLMRVLEESFDAFGLAGNLLPLISRGISTDPGEERLRLTGLRTPISRESAIERSATLEKRLRRLLECRNDPARTEFALIALTGSTTNVHTALVIDQLLTEGKGVIVCDLSGKGDLEDILRPLKITRDREAIISLMLVVGKADRRYEDEDKGRDGPFQRRFDKPRALRFLSDIRGVGPSALSAFNSNTLPQLLHANIEVLSLVEDDVRVPPGDAGDVLDEENPVPIGTTLAEQLSRGVRLVRGQPLSNTIIKLQRNGAHGLPAFEAAEIATTLEVLPFGVIRHEIRKGGRFPTPITRPLPTILWYPNP